jgi:hypothetical protein
MPFWSDASLEPKLSFRWFATFGSGIDIVNTYALRSMQKPSFEIGISEYININDVSYRPGILSWNPIEITITDMANSSENNTLKLYNILRRSGYQNENPSLPQGAIEKRAVRDALGGDVRFTQIDANADMLEEWVLVNPIIASINFGQANYTAEEIMSISLSLRYDYATHRLR